MGDEGVCMHKTLTLWGSLHRTQRVKRVMRKLIPFSGMVDENWEIFVIDDPSKLAPHHPGCSFFEHIPSRRASFL